MTNDLISREAAIALLTERKNECPLESVQRYVMAAAIEALTNMPSAESGLQEEIAELKLDVAHLEDSIQYPRDYT